MSRLPLTAVIVVATLLTATAALAGEKRTVFVSVCPYPDWELIAELGANPEIAVEFVCQITDINGIRRTVPVPIP